MISPTLHNPRQRRLTTCLALVVVLFAGLVQAGELLHQHSGEEPAHCLFCKTGGASAPTASTLPVLFTPGPGLCAERRADPVISNAAPLPPSRGPPQHS